MESLEILKPRRSEIFRKSGTKRKTTPETIRRLAALSLEILRSLKK